MRRMLISVLVLTASVWFGATCFAEGAQAERQSSNAPRAGQDRASGPRAIAVRSNASAIEWFAANEIRRYVYLRTGKLLPVKRGPVASPCVSVSCKDVRFCGDLGETSGRSSSR